jgi:glutamate-1-semialdehyde 2,1-aminomutase
MTERVRMVRTVTEGLGVELSGLQLDRQFPTERSEELSRRASKLAPKGVQGGGRWYEPFPLFIEKAMGARLWDVDGNEFIDYHASYGPAILGYNDPSVRAAVIQTLESQGVLFGAPHAKEVELAEVFSEIVPCAEKTVLCGGGGSDPMYNAVRLARAHTGREKILKFEGSYHGWHDYVSVSVRPDAKQAGERQAPTAVPESAGALQAAVDRVVVAPLNDRPSLETIVDRHRQELAAIIVEPFCHTPCGCVLHQEGILERVRELCNVHGIVLIFDEVVTGFRHDLGGAQAILGIVPDLGVFGKAMANGFTLGALAGKSEMMSLLGPEGPVLFSGTYNGHLIGVAAALATIGQLADGEIHKRIRQYGDYLSEEINEVIRSLKLRATCRNIGSIWTVYFGQPVESFRDIIAIKEEPATQWKDDAFRTALLNAGIYMQPGFANRGFIGGAHTEADIAYTIQRIKRFLEEHRSALS